MKEKHEKDLKKHKDLLESMNQVLEQKVQERTFCMRPKVEPGGQGPGRPVVTGGFRNLFPESDDFIPGRSLGKIYK